MELSLLLILMLAADTTPPVIHGRLVPPPGLNGWNRDAPPVVHFDCTDDVQLVTCAPSHRVLFEEGRGIQVTGTAIDAAGNTSTTTMVVNFDLYPPEMAVEETPNLVASPRLTVRGHASDAVSGLHAVRCVVHEMGINVAATVAREKFECTVPLLGRNRETRIEVRGEDRAGNSTHRMVHVKSDTSPPEIHIELPRERERITRGSSVRLLAHVQDGSVDSFDQVHLNGAPFVPDGGRIDATLPLAVGRNEILIEAADPLGNRQVECLVVERLAPGNPRTLESVVEVIPFLFPAGEGHYRVRAIISPPRCGYFHGWRAADAQGRPHPGVTFTSTPECRNESECWVKFRAASTGDLHIGVAFAFEETEDCHDQ